ncbi:MAG: YidC/Oxa1 family membrane protein insertase, partial [Moraxellaceae bacterium]
MAVNKMDWQKNILLAAILGLLFALAIRWNNYQEQHAPVAVVNPVVESTASVSDIPTPVVNTSEVKDAGNATTLVAPSTDTIKVATDSLLVDINPVGGDIIKVALPRHYADIDTPDVPFILIDNNASHTYVAQSGLVGANGTDNDKGRPTFRAERTQFTLDEGQNQLIVDLVFQQEQVKITKRFTFTRGQYLVAVEYIIDNQSANKWSGNFYAQIKRDSKSFTQTNLLAMNPFLGGAIHTTEEKYKKVTFADLDKAPVDATEKGGWVSLVQHYFISAWIPDAETTNNYKLRKLGD